LEPLIVVGDILQISFVQTLYQQRVLNVVHARVEQLGSITNYQEYAQSLAADLVEEFGATGIFNAWRQLVLGNLVFDAVRVQVVYPVRQPYYQDVTLWSGAVVNTNMATANVALSVTKRSETAGRMGVGHMQLAGLDPTRIDQGRWDATLLGEVQQAFEWLTLPYEGTESESTIRFIIRGNGQPAAYHRITDIIPQPTVRTMHRRTVGLGE